MSRQKRACLVWFCCDHSKRDPHPTSGPRITVSPGPQRLVCIFGSLWCLAPNWSRQQSVYLFSERECSGRTRWEELLWAVFEWLSEQSLKSGIFTSDVIVLPAWVSLKKEPDSRVPEQEAPPGQLGGDETTQDHSRPCAALWQSQPAVLSGNERLHLQLTEFHWSCIFKWPHRPFSFYLEITVDLSTFSNSGKCDLWI